MSINSINSNSALYESLLQKIAGSTKPSGNNTYADAAQTKIDSSQQTSQAGQPTQQDIKALLNKLLGSQPTLMDFMNDDSSSTDDFMGLSTDLDPSMDSTTNDLSGFDPLSAQIQALSGMDSNTDSNTESSDPVSSLWSSLGSTNQNSSELLNLLEKAYSQSSQEAQSQAAAGQVVDQKK